MPFIAYREIIILSIVCKRAREAAWQYLEFDSALQSVSRVLREGILFRVSATSLGSSGDIRAEMPRTLRFCNQITR